jgi:hypothetical protein
MNGNDAPKPRMPAIAHLAFVGPVGVPSSRCTTRCDRTPPMAVGHPRQRISGPRAPGCATPTSSAARPLPSSHRSRYEQPGLSFLLRDRRGAGHQISHGRGCIGLQNLR